ncbi:MAG: sugar phosphate isomerase/epimerase family protein [Candidatus Azotimanducaceae bacterium]|tara:strand:+ start:590 stop:1546 length:957 start_codon:yes stop_codon:yes gene_type:complete
MKRKKFIKLASTGAIGISSLGYMSFSKPKDLFFKLSLAQWSLHRNIKYGNMNPYKFAEFASNNNFSGIEYVTALYDDVMEVRNADMVRAITFWARKNKELADQNNIKNVLIMIDELEALADPNQSNRNKAIENHKMWIDAAAIMNCESVRLNLYGSSNVKIWKELSMESLSNLGEYAKKIGINVMVENHGRITSNIPELMKVINGVNMDNVGTLPDFGNFCMADEGYGSVFGGACEEAYDFYKGVGEMMPKAFAVSAKSNDFDLNGYETTIDYTKMLKIVKEYDYTGFIGVEYEGNRLTELQGIKATRDLLIKIGQTI